MAKGLVKKGPAKKEKKPRRRPGTNGVQLNSANKARTEGRSRNQLTYPGDFMFTA